MTSRCQLHLSCEASSLLRDRSFKVSFYTQSPDAAVQIDSKTPTDLPEGIPLFEASLLFRDRCFSRPSLTKGPRSLRDAARQGALRLLRCASALRVTGRVPEAQMPLRAVFDGLWLYMGGAESAPRNRPQICQGRRGSLPGLCTQRGGSRHIRRPRRNPGAACAAPKKTACGVCGRGHPSYYDKRLRRIRDLSCGDTRVYLAVELRRVDCRKCGKVKREGLEWLARQPVLHQALRLLRGRKCADPDDPGRGQGAASGLAHGQGAGQAVHGGAAQTAGQPRRR